jgi:hypothetical protein
MRRRCDFSVCIFCWKALLIRNLFRLDFNWKGGRLNDFIHESVGFW